MPSGATGRTPARLQFEFVTKLAGTAGVGGQPLASFEGPQPPGHLRRWVDSLLAATAGKLPGGPAADGEAEAADPVLEDAREKLDAGDFLAAAAAYQAIERELTDERLLKVVSAVSTPATLAVVLPHTAAAGRASWYLTAIREPQSSSEMTPGKSTLAPGSSSVVKLPE